jgi:hypothetical protein
VSTLLLLVVLGMAGTQTRTFLAVEKAPWAAYQDEVAQMLAVHRSAYERATPADKEKQQRHLALLTTFSAPYWKWVYSAVLLLGVWLTNWRVLLWMMKLTRHFLRDHRGGGTRTQKASVLFVCALMSFLIALAVLPILSLLTSPIGFAIFVPLLLGNPWLIAGGFLGDYWLEWSTAPAWLKATVGTSILPGLTFLVLAIPGLLEKTALAVAHERGKQLVLKLSAALDLRLQVLAIVAVMVWVAWEMLRFMLFKT